MKRLGFITVVALMAAVAATENLGTAEECSEENGGDGFFADDVRCDKYYECKEGALLEHTCKDGLVFDASNKKFAVCSFPISIDCSGREELQEPNPTENCPRQNGYFPHPDPKICDKFFQCVDGVANPITCPTSLVFDPNRGQCVYEEQAKREGCSTNEDNFDELYNFRCPLEGRNPAVHPRFPDPHDCQYFYICIGGRDPQRSGCAVGLVFNPDKLACDHPDNVVGECHTWYNATFLESVGGLSPQAVAEAGVSLDTVVRRKQPIQRGKNNREPTQAAEKVHVDFSCPPSNNPHLHPRFPDPNDCQYFYICISGTTPRRNGCTVGLVYNPEKKACDLPKNVVGECRTWYDEDVTVSPEHAAEAGVSLDQIPDQSGTPPQIEIAAEAPTPEEGAPKATPGRAVIKRVRTRVRGRRSPQRPVAVAQEKEAATGSRF